MMKITVSFVLLALLGLTSCSDAYSVDMTKVDFPAVSKLDRSSIDGILEVEKVWADSQLNDSFVVKTDMKTYHFGDEVILTIQNNSSETEYFYRDPKESRKALSEYSGLSLDQSTINKLKEELVSQDPAINGFVSDYESYMVHISLTGLNTDLASRIGVEGFEDPLLPGETMTFRVTMPNRSGHYRFALKRHSRVMHELLAYESKQYLVSNIFEIVEK